MKLRPSLLAALVLASIALSGRTEAGIAPAKAWVAVPAGDYRPLLRGKNEPERVLVPVFWMQRLPVTNADFLAFVRARPEWRRSRVSRLFADQNYLAAWAGDEELGPGAAPDAPVVRASWFAARAYTEWIGARLPTTAEWERAAAVGFTSDEAAREPAVRELIDAWFARPASERLPAAGLGRPNRLGLHDLHGLVWEWVEDFDAALVTGESRGDASLERDLFCGAGSVGARDKTDYPAFMRAGFRSSLRAPYTVGSLGFRCVRSP
jgi:formylglycine-generating enzyme required for sulfatase activity